MRITGKIDSDKVESNIDDKDEVSAIVEMPTLNSTAAQSVTHYIHNTVKDTQPHEGR